jgi:hypothetical protein
MSPTAQTPLHTPTRARCHRLVAIRARLLSRALSSDGQECRQETLGLIEALLRCIFGVAGVGAFVRSSHAVGTVVRRTRQRMQSDSNLRTFVQIPYAARSQGPGRGTGLNMARIELITVSWGEPREDITDS